ncbi:MAG: porin [Bacteroidaceae bacterium]|nr:porin [Bacteroidaceae bacterium]
MKQFSLQTNIRLSLGKGLSIALLMLALNSQAQQIDMDNGVLGIADDRGFTLQSKDGRFVFKPYLFLQTRGQLNYYDDEGLDKAYNQDNVANSGFAVPYAILGFTGKTFGCLDYNLSINAAATGANVLQQAWIDYSISPAARFRAGKFKTPFTHAYLTTLGETLFPMLPTSLTTSAIMPHTLNAVNPQIGTGFDVGVEFHGQARLKPTTQWLMGYEVGLWNGSGSVVNGASKTFSDDWHIPSLLYAGRLTFMPWGSMPMTQGNSRMLKGRHMQFGVSGGLNVESESESTNDARLGAEFSMLYNRWYVGAEAYWMHVGFTSRQKIDTKFNYWGAYGQVGYFLLPTLQMGLRYDFMDRNSSSKDGFLNMPAFVCNYYIPKVHLKLSAMYQFTGRYGHDTQLDRDNDDLGISTHHASLQVQFSF